MLTRVIRRVGYSGVARRAVTESSAMEPVTRRFIGGVDEASAVATAERIAERGLLTTVHVRRGPVVDDAAADEHVAAYADLADRIATAGLAPGSEISVKIAQFGLLAPGSWDSAFARLAAMVDDAYARGVRVTVDMEGEDEVGDTLEAVRLLRQRHPDVGVCVQAYLYRTEADCAALATSGSRVRLVKGGYGAGQDIAHGSRREIDAAYLRCLGVLMRGEGYPMVASHDLRLVEATRRLAAETGRTPEDYELQMLHGVRTRDQSRLSAEGDRLRVYVPYGPEWYPWFVHRIAEKPSNLRLLGHALLPGSRS